jgi:DsbC/DsbD-like thiol-disulfide interchange protein
MKQAILSLLAAAATVCAAAAQQTAPTPIRWSAADEKVSAKPGETIVVRIAAQIDDGWHLYALDPIEGGPIPTKLSVAPAPPFSLLEKEIDKPEPKRAQDPNFGVETAYYEESATFGLPIALAKNAPAGERVVEISARFQACNDSICLRPQTQTLRVTVTVKP